tara:strand:+ start:7854 stop:8699 length:846 start_codon:yes stop_codon:yes gene_type:complete
MHKIMLFVDARFPPENECLNKAISIAKAFKLPIDLLLDVRKPHLERWYWPELLEMHALGDKTEDEANNVILSIQKTLSTSCVKSTVTRLDKPAFSGQISTLSETLANCLLLISSELKDKARAKFQEIVEVHAPTLVLTQQAWRSPLNLAVAIDPLHENAIDTQVDDRLFNQAATIKKKLETNFFLLHSCYIPPMAIDYHKQIIQIHKEAVNEFAETKCINTIDINIIKGNPEETIPSWVTDNQIDILAMGQFRRSKIKQYLIGSTAMTLIERMPCDLLLVS